MHMHACTHVCTCILAHIGAGLAEWLRNLFLNHMVSGSVTLHNAFTMSPGPTIVLGDNEADKS